MAERPFEAQTQAEEEPTVSTPENLPEGTPPQKESKKTKPVVVETTPAGPQIKKIRLSDGSFHFLDIQRIERMGCGGCDAAKKRQQNRYE